jgi:endonuclease YncB( thermonuclease family)
MRAAAVVFVVSLALLPATADAAQNVWFPVPPTAAFQTGDAWVDGGVTYRLYGVQACLRGTDFTNSHGLTRDCGEASLAMLVALVRDLQPQCYAAAKSPETETMFVFCVATRRTGVGAGTRIDLGTALISIGYAFAARDAQGRPVHAPYFAAELVAQKAKAGFWAFPDLPDPNAIILRALRSSSSVSAIPSPQSGPAPRRP